MIHWFIKLPARRKISDIGRKVINWLIKAAPKNKMSNTLWQRSTGRFKLYPKER